MLFRFKIHLQLGERTLIFHRDAESTSIQYTSLVQSVNEQSPWWSSSIDSDPMTQAVIYIVKSPKDEVRLGKLEAQSDDVKFVADRPLIGLRYPVKGNRVGIRIQVMGSSSTRTATSVGPKPPKILRSTSWPPKHGLLLSACSQPRICLSVRSASGPIITQAPGVITSNSCIEPPILHRVASSAPDPQNLTNPQNIDPLGLPTPGPKPDQDSGLDRFIEVARYCVRDITPKPPKITYGYFYETLEAEKILSLEPLSAEDTWKLRFIRLKDRIAQAELTIKLPSEGAVNRWHQKSQKWVQLTEEQRQEYRPKLFTGLNTITKLQKLN